ncbi:hypothetical protein ACFTXB_01525 [Streptomyces sp. NPDC057074]|uniref:hypothetical protein n=1 Tax=Streptomyces sp. NPDC057074 TaxID=3346015 RepID=UPI0036426091
MNALTARCALDALALPAGAAVLVTGAAGAVGGYTVQLAAATGLISVAVAAGADEVLVRGFGARHFVASDSQVTERVRGLVPGGVDGVVDTAMMHGAVAPALRDGGAMAVLRFWDGAPGRGITVHPVNVRDHVSDHAAIETLRAQVEQGVLGLRVAAAFLAERPPAPTGDWSRAASGDASSLSSRPTRSQDERSTPTGPSPLRGRGRRTVGQAP